MAKKQLTSRQLEILMFIKSFKKSNGWAPTTQEIADHFGFKSRNSVSDFLKALESKGFIKTGKNKARAIEVL